MASQLYCAETGFFLEQTEQKILRLGPRMKLRQKLSGLIYLKRRYDASQGESLDGDLKKYYGGTNSVLSQIPQRDLNNIFTRSTEMNVAKKLADYLCEGKRVYPDKLASARFDTKWFYLGSTRPLLRQIHNQLNRKNIVAINYYADFFDQDGAPKTLEGKHASSIVGRRWNQEKRTCELPIRNSWGNRCSGYKAASFQEPGACEKGNIWVNEDVLRKYLSGNIYLRK